LRRIAVLVALLCLPAAPARANGDPASDTLLYANAHYPYQPNLVGVPLQRALDKMLKQTKAKGYPLKVAIIFARTDLGAVPQLFTTPQKYADLLTQELSFNQKPKVLVVLPAGIGGNNLGDNAGAALRDVTPPPDATPDDLARTAMRAVGALAKANGTPVPVPAVKAAARKTGGGTSPLLTFGLPVLLVALVAGVAAARGRNREPEDDEAEVMRISPDGE